MMDAMIRLFQDKQPVRIEFTKQQLWMILATIQLACRHPKFNCPTRQAVEEWAREVGAAIVSNDQDLRMLFEMGWNKQFDKRIEG